MVAGFSLIIALASSVLDRIIEEWWPVGRSEPAQFHTDLAPDQPPGQN